MLKQQVVQVILCLCGVTLVASVPSSDFYPTDHGPTITADDGFSPPIRGSTAFPFFGRKYEFIVVNANGLLSFDSYLHNTWEPFLFPKKSDASVENNALLAPYLADIDATRGGSIQYKVYRFSPTTLPLLYRVSLDVRKFFPYASDFDARFLLVATWTNIAPYCDEFCASGRNTFQIAYVTNYTWAFAIYNYADNGINWGSFRRDRATYYAVAGFDAADNIHYHNISGSLQPSIANVDRKTNVRIPGKFAFHVDNNVDNAPKPCRGDITCQNGGTCADTSYCDCVKGWGGSYCETDVDECRVDNGGCMQGCANTAGSFLCTCTIGYALDFSASHCTDVNECLSSNGGCSHLCNNTEGSYSCKCHSGFKLSVDRFNCDDIDECSTNNGGCADRCINVPGSYACACEEDHIWVAANKSCIPRNVYFMCEPTCFHGGFCISENTCSCPGNWTGDHCEVDVNECEVVNGGCAQTCHNTDGSRYCSCHGGFTLAVDGKTCFDVDECTTTEHHCDQICVNLAGNYSCNCVDGYILQPNEIECTDVDECLTDNGGCEEICANLPGSYTCACGCGKELNGDGTSCTIVDSCLVNNGGCEHFCDRGGQCSCLSGYQLAADGKHCEDVDECKIRSGGCSHNCHNLPGSFACLCRPGYVLRNDSKTCDNGDPCSVDNGGCDQICLPGGACTCIDGYTVHADGKQCEDIDECSGHHGCQHLCINSPGSFTCSCNSGWEIAVDGTSCQIDDPCVVNNGGCEQFCANGHCSCLTGFELGPDRKQCVDIDECEVRNGGCLSNQVCDNIPGSARCVCPSGMIIGEDNITCVSLDPCSFNQGNCEQLCVSPQGTCQCYPGYSLDEDGQSCTDIDECDSHGTQCIHQCLNTDGSFHCVCNDGWTLEENGRSCSLTDECLVNNGGCEHFCSNGICSCLTGFILDAGGKSCNDIDECLVRSGGCGSRQICVNVKGSYQCLCEPGSKLDNATNNCESTDPCDYNNGGCEQVCQKGGKCSCLSGFRVEDSSCIDIDECLMTNGGCQSNCNNLPGSYACSCDSGYQLGMDGRSCAPLPTRDPCALSNGGCQHFCGSGGSCSCFPGFALALNFKNCSFDAAIDSAEVAPAEKCSSCLSVSWSRSAFTASRKPFTLFYEVDCAQVKGRGGVTVITEHLKMVVAGLNHSTEYRCIVTPISSSGRGRPTNAALALTGAPIAEAFAVGPTTVLDQIMVPYIVFPIIGVLLLLLVICGLTACICCCCCKPSKWSSYNVSKAERKCSVILSPADQYLLSPSVNMNPSPKNTNKRCHFQKNPPIAITNAVMTPVEISSDDHSPSPSFDEQ